MMDDLDRILVSEEGLTPSAGFLASAMGAVRECRRYDVPIAFPWKRFATGLVGGLLCTVLSVILLGPELSSVGLPEVKSWLPISPGLCPPEIVWAVLALLGSLLAVQVTVVCTSD